MSLKPNCRGVTDSTIVLPKSLHFLAQKIITTTEYVIGITTLEVTIESYFFINKS